jgi:hypothetical protein
MARPAPNQRWTLSLLAAIVAGLLLAAPAAAHTEQSYLEGRTYDEQVVLDDDRLLIVDEFDRAGAPFQTWVAEAHVPTPRGGIYVALDLANHQRSWMEGPRTIHWYADPEATHSWSGARPTFLHELGHVYDYTALKMRTRNRLAKLFPNWWLGQGGFTEQFGMFYAYCALGAYPVEGWSGYKYRPPVWKHERGCRILRRGA